LANRIPPVGFCGLQARNSGNQYMKVRRCGVSFAAIAV